MRRESTLAVLADSGAALVAPPSWSVSEVVPHSRQVLQRMSPRLHNALMADVQDSLLWAKQGPAWRLIVTSSVAAICAVGLFGVATFVMALLVTAVVGLLSAVLFTTAAVSAVLTVCLTTIAVLGIGVLAVAGTIISVVAFCSVLGILLCGASILSAYIVWRVTSATVQGCRSLLFPAGFAGRSMPALAAEQSSTGAATNEFDKPEPLQEKKAHVNVAVTEQAKDTAKGFVVTFQPAADVKKAVVPSSVGRNSAHLAEPYMAS